ncbi:polysaccharide biosynthesis C-terminal domain-containing protein [Salibacteraceae bacterium]|nr:polysaccharide biosynthesis C-terminal domain-containing protein [Salibacteraceae bacterium]
MTSKRTKDVAVYLFAGLIPSILGFALVPIYTRFLTPSDYGVIVIISVIVFTIRPFVLMGTSRMLEVEYFKLEKENVSKLVGFSILNSLVISIILFCLFVVARNWVNEVLFHNEINNINWLLFIPLVAFGFAINSIGSILFRNSQNSKAYLLVSFGKSFLEHALGLLLIVTLFFAWQGKMLGIVVSSVFSLIVIIIYLIRTNKVSFSISFFKDKLSIYKSVIPLLVMDISILGIESSDRLFISIMSEEGTSAAGVYSIAYLIGGAVVYIINAFTNVFSPEVFELLALKTEKAKQIIVKRFYSFFLAILGIATLISLSKSVIFDYFIGPDFYAGIELVSLIAFSFVFQVMFLLGYNICMYRGKSKLPSRISVLAFILNAVLNYVLIKTMGLKGAAVSTLITYAFMGLATLFISQLLIKLPWFYFLKSDN